MSRALLAAALLTAVLASATTAAAAPSPNPSATASPTATPSPSYSPAPTVDAATRELQRQQKALATESARLARAALDATATLQSFQRAKRDAADATTAATLAVQHARDAKAAALVAHAQLQGYARSLYRFGTVDPRLLILTASLSAKGPEQFFSGLDAARQVGERRASVLNGLTAAQAAQASAADAAKAAAAAQASATVAAATANAAATKAVAAYRSQVTARRLQVASSGTVLQAAKARAIAIGAADAIARGQGWTPKPPCAGGDLTGFDNGKLPLAALCPLLFTASMRLRADAAYSFDNMATEYAAAFGTPLCVTDSYRSFDQQVVVAAEKPLLAAHPGRSNHGWGIAVDLCGGIERFGTPAHQWLLDNCVLFGWFHPAWAEPTGTKPEPWHWEFAG